MNSQSRWSKRGRLKQPSNTCPGGSGTAKMFTRVRPNDNRRRMSRTSLEFSCADVFKTAGLA
jgi:hypothetical protein